jgi:thioredoxin reductase (NADPH)
MITSEVENFPGFPDGIDGPELISRFNQQAQKFGAKSSLSCVSLCFIVPDTFPAFVTVVERWASNFRLQPGGPHQATVGDELFEFESIIFANGAAARWLNAPGEDEYVNKGISACATCDGPLPVFRNKHIFVIGGGDTALEGMLPKSLTLPRSTHRIGF